MRVRTTAVVGAMVVGSGVAIGAVWTSASNDPEQERASRAEEVPTEGPTTTRPASSSSTATSTTLNSGESLVYKACAEPYRVTQLTIELKAALIHESPDNETARIRAAQAEAARLAADAARLDPEFEGFAAAQTYLRDHATRKAGARIEPQLEVAIATVSDVCTQVGPNGKEFIEIPYEELSADTAEHGRFDACADLVFGRDGAVYSGGERFTYEDCDRATEPALAEANRADAYRTAVSMFLAETGGFICWGDECRDESDFSPYSAGM